MTKRILMLAGFVTLSVGLSGCDSDGDGISNKEEKELGLDPKSADSDGDGMSDGDELAFGSDPLVDDADGDGLSDADEQAVGSDPNNPDTDDDTYLDGDEVFEGTDPADKKSRIYKGYWPYWRDKDELGNKSMGGSIAVGDKFGRVKAKDQNRDLVDLYDFAGPDQTWKFIVIDASAEWCGPCQAGSMWLGGGQDYYGLEADYAEVRAAVDDGELGWITILTQDQNGDPADVDAARRWDDAYPHEMVPVMGDDSGEVEDAVIGTLGGWPAGAIVAAENMKVKDLDYMIPGLLEAAKGRL